jgi:hypothetical protein
MEEGVCGFMSEVGDITDMCEKALRILSDDASLRQFKDNALKQALRFDCARIVPEYEALYKRFAR